MSLHTSALVAAALSLLAVPLSASAGSNHGVTMEVLVDGRPLAELRNDGRTYVEARKNRNYTIRLRNDTGGRVAVALAVDGLNTIDAKHTSAKAAAKWVLSPYETAEIQGWQVDDGHARKFLFTSEEKSYGAWIGDSRNLGVVSAVFFAERSDEVCCFEPRPRPYGRSGYGDDATGSLQGDGRRDESGSARASGESKAGKAKKPSSSADVAEAEATTSRRGGAVAAPSPKKEERAATGMGSRTKHDVQWTRFELDPSPLASVELRYAFRDELVALGIDPDWGTVTPAIRRREQSAGFAPDPGLACCR